MKTILFVTLLACALSVGACSRSDEQPDAAAQTTQKPNLKSDAERLQQATAKAAEERKRAQPAESPAPSAPQP
jgi:Na+-transporting methylmalonyl-CoA/oxaloacetate decarboxylase gamma subunit